MQEKVFIPKYPPSIYIVFLIMIPGILALVIKSIFEGDISPDKIPLLVFGVFMIVIPIYTIIAAITLSTDSFTVKRYLLPDQTIAYSEVTLINDEIIITNRGILFIRYIKNSNELLGIFRGRVEKVKTYRDYDKDSEVEHKKINPVAVVLPLVIAGGLLALIYFIWPYDYSLLRSLAPPISC
jgi:hypothetical protein